MQHEPDVRFVDSQAEGVGRHDRADLFLHEEIMDGRAILFMQLRMVHGCRYAQLTRQVALNL